MIKTQDMQYRDGELSLNGYLAYDDSFEAKRPGVLVVHEAFGLGEHAMERAKMLAELGYVAFAADMFGDRKLVQDLPPAIELITPFRDDPKLWRTRALAALDVLKGLPQADAGRLGGIGFCFGGSTVLELARDGAELRGVVSFHGALETKAPAQAGAVKASVLVCTGADDPMVTAVQVAAFEAEMRQAGADWQVISYGNTVHSFTNPAAGSVGIPALAYSGRSDRRSWLAMRSFFDEIFA